jgi:hypothetical protein
MEETGPDKYIMVRMLSKTRTIFGYSLLGTELSRKLYIILCPIAPLRSKSINIKALAAEATSLFFPVYAIRHYNETPLFSSHSYLN